MAANQALWNEWTAIHEASAFYDLDGFKKGGIRLRDYELAEVGDVRDKELLHLQCHFGIDTLSWARAGARPTGVDYSEKAVTLARALAEELGLEASSSTRTSTSCRMCSTGSSTSSTRRAG